MSRSAEDDRVVPFGDGGPVETLDKLAGIRLGSTRTHARGSLLHLQSLRPGRCRITSGVANLLLPFCELQLTAGWRGTNLCAHMCVYFLTVQLLSVKTKTLHPTTIRAGMTKEWKNTHMRARTHSASHDRLPHLGSLFASLIEREMR